jgi:hypothetical protein
MKASEQTGQNDEIIQLTKRIRNLEEHNRDLMGILSMGDHKTNGLPYRRMATNDLNFFT